MDIPYARAGLMVNAMQYKLSKNNSVIAHQYPILFLKFFINNWYREAASMLLNQALYQAHTLY